MRILCALLLAVAACGGPAKKPEGAIVNEGPAPAPDTCCCKYIPLTSADGQPVYEDGGRMECSGKDGTCVDEVQCQGATDGTDGAGMGADPGSTLPE